MKNIFIPHLKPVLFLVFAFGLIFLPVQCSRLSDQKDSWLETLFDEGRQVFFRTIKIEITNHPEKNQLKSEELQKIFRIEKTHPRLYGILMNYYYQKEEQAFQALLKNGSEESKSKFRRMYLSLARFSGRTFVECFFLTDKRSQYFRELRPRFKGKDAVDLVLMSTGYFAKLDLPGEKRLAKPLSQEFEKQWGLDAARFRLAHRITRGRGVKIAVLDSGIDTAHPVFNNTLWGNHFNFVGRDGFPWSAAGPPMVDWGWHGTVVTSIVASYAPESQITVYRDMDADTQNDSPYPTIVTALMGAAIYKAVHDGNDVINISAGSNVDSAYLKGACRYAYENNVIVVTASPYYLGRFLGESSNYPGQYETTISVTGIEKKGNDQYGYWEVAAPEVTTTVGAPSAPFVAFPTYVEEKDDYAPGISCATPIVASLVALVVSVYPRLGTERPGDYFETVKRLLIENANSEALGFEGFSPECGYGLIDAEKTIKAALELSARRQTSPKAPSSGRGK